jgi:hypothetical protein
MVRFLSFFSLFVVSTKISKVCRVDPLVCYASRVMMYIVDRCCHVRGNPVWGSTRDARVISHALRLSCAALPSSPCAAHDSLAWFVSACR